VKERKTLKGFGISSLPGVPTVLEDEMRPVTEGSRSLTGVEFCPGQEIVEYRILKQIGKGGMAELFLATDLSLKRKVVIKVLAPFLRQRKDFRRQFLREARIQANLDNPCIVQILRILEHGDHFCLVMQHVMGTDLEKVIRKAKALKEARGEKGALSLERAVHIFLQVLEGIGFAHKYRIIHGDIKPSNILLDKQGRAKVADFGLAFPLSYYDGGLRQEMPHAGTPFFMSPEQLLNLKVDFRSDIYALGVTFFYMLTAQFPSGEKKRLMDLLEAHMEGSLEEASGILAEFGEIPSRIKEAILKALENDPNKRHQSCLEFALALKEERPYEMYSELLRLSLLTKREFSPSERAYLDDIAGRKGLRPEEALSVEIHIRNEMGLPRLDFAREYKMAFNELLKTGREKDAYCLAEMERVYVGKQRISSTRATGVREEVLMTCAPEGV
jgi:serine/threonine protein kinase